MSSRMIKSGMPAIAAVLLASTSPAQTTTYTGSNGTNGDNWSNPARWSAGVPSGSTSAIIPASKQTSTDGGTATAYTGDLTMGTNSYLGIGWVNPRHLADFNGLGTPGSTTIFMHTGSFIHIRAGNNNGSAAQILPAIQLEGNAGMRLNSSTEPPEDFDFAHGINGPYRFTMYGKGNQDARLTASNSFEELVIDSSEGSWDVLANAADSLNGNVTVKAFNGGPAGDLIVNSSQAFSDETILKLNGTNPVTLITMNVEDRVFELWINDVQIDDGEYTNTETWLSGSGTLIVKGPPAGMVIQLY